MGKEWADARRAANVARLAATLATALAGRTDITFELGCGHGHWLAAYAAAHPDEFCVGIDLITHRVERSVRKQTLGKLDNVIFLKAEATEFLEALPPAVVLRKIFILYPDPWPKKKHHKHRFIQTSSLDLSPIAPPPVRACTSAPTISITRNGRAHTSPNTPPGS